MPQDDEKDPEVGTDDAKVDRILSGMKGARMPDILKVQSSESRGEKFASYQGSHELKPSEDTQQDVPAVLVDQTQQEGISADEIASLKNERRERNRREATTAVIELDTVPKKKSSAPLLLFVVLLGVAAVALFVKSRSGTDEDGVIAPATAASVIDTTTQSNIPAPPVSTAVAPTTTATIEPNSAQTSASPASANPTSVSSHSSGHASAAASGSADPDLLLFKPHRTP